MFFQLIPLNILLPVSFRTESMAEAPSVHTGDSAEYPRSLYGKACMDCARSKTKCTVSRIGGKCERHAFPESDCTLPERLLTKGFDRCNRLNKNCRQSTTARKSDARTARSPIASLTQKTNALEDKLDSIVQILQQSHSEASSLPLGSPHSLQTFNQSQNSSPQDHVSKKSPYDDICSR
jgi:hypothetical protein